MSLSESPLQSYYAARAPEYDSIYSKPERQPDLRAIEHWLRTRFTGAAVLEIACGTGYWTQFIAPSAASVVAVDSAPETLRIAQARVPEENVQFVVEDAYALPAHLGEFSAAFAGFWFSHVPTNRRREFLLHLGARLEPGATVVLLDNLFVPGSSSPISEQDTEGNTYQTRSLSNGSTHRVLKNFPTEAELQASINGLGTSGTFMRWNYFWAFEYLTSGGSIHP
jgi:SAM-dependent methyltransferase